MMIYSVTDGPDAIDRTYFGMLRDARRYAKERGGEIVAHTAHDIRPQHLLAAAMNGDHGWCAREWDVNK